jgi:hypothetical protein
MTAEISCGTDDISNHQTHRHFCDDLLAWKYFVEKSHNSALRNAGCPSEDGKQVRGR